ncbi:MAG: transcription repressor NadR [Coriobacteriaceae bacterium]|nr:transcription repressor NadR [Coriobacteriaceae bacterium]
MKGAERREAIRRELHGAVSPISGSALARAVGVSRQVIVQDIALLRANGDDVVATARGYVLREGPEPRLPTRVVKVHHGVDQVEEELNCIVDLGGAVQNVMVNHRVYGAITAELDIRSRRDAARYLADIGSGKSVPLMTVTSGYHFHRITADTEGQLDEIEAALEQRGFLAELMPYEQDVR